LAVPILHTDPRIRVFMQFRVDNARRQLQKSMPFCLTGRGNGLELESATKRCSAQVRPRPCCGARLRAICSRVRLRLVQRQQAGGVLQDWPTKAEPRRP